MLCLYLLSINVDIYLLSIDVDYRLLSIDVDIYLLAIEVDKRPVRTIPEKRSDLFLKGRFCRKSCQFY